MIEATPLTCQQCASEFPRKKTGPPARYCSGTCRARACTERAEKDGRREKWTANAKARKTAKRNPSLPDRACPGCGKSFTPRTSAQHFCSPVTEQEKKVGRSACAWRWDAAQRRQRQGKAPAPPYDCAQCGKRCTPGENVVAHASRFCGQACKKDWHYEHIGGPRLRRLNRRARAQAKLARSAQQGRVAVWTAGACVQCGDTFVSAHPDTMTCSGSCSLERKRAHRRGHRARARLHGVAYEPITPRKVFIRDSYRCRLCGKATKATAVVPHPRAPTLDHIVPMSLGGPHLYVNVQCACFICNSRKAARLDGDQLLLVG